jgi:hypothetical protein
LGASYKKEIEAIAAVRKFDGCLTFGQPITIVHVEPYPRKAKVKDDYPLSAPEAAGKMDGDVAPERQISLNAGSEDSDEPGGEAKIGGAETNNQLILLSPRPLTNGKLISRPAYVACRLWELCSRLNVRFSNPRILTIRWKSPVARSLMKMSIFLLWFFMLFEVSLRFFRIAQRFFKNGLLSSSRLG